MNVFQRFATILLVVSFSIGPSRLTSADSRIYLPLIAKSDDAWSTVAANPQRTSWVRQDAPSDVHVEWYRPIDAYIPPSFQIISAQGLVYIATARGLYALDAATGTTAWRYDTELPLGNSPTVADGLVFFGGYDRKVHALNATTGQQVWEFAGAGAGYDTNPLVVNQRVYLGNRDGRFYALNAVDGRLLWQYPPAGQDPLAPIHLSAAYKNNQIYFASNDNHAYALNANDGALLWKSKKLVGDGYDVFWPVVYHEPSNNKDYLIYSGSLAYRESIRPGTQSISGADTYPLYDGVWTGWTRDTLGPTVTLNEPWARNKTVVDYSRVVQLYENHPDNDPNLHKPWLRIYTILDAATGQEITMDTDHDGYGEYFPVLPIFNPGNMHPPVIGKDNLVYVSNSYQRNGQGRVMGWKFGTPYFAISPLAGANDEPQILSSAGNSVYRVLCCDRVGDRATIDNPSSRGLLWHYGDALSDLAPGYDEKMWFIDPDILDRITGVYGNANGIYGEHGYQNPVVAAGGRLFVHRSNAVIAFGAGPAQGRRPLLTSAPTQQALTTPTTPELAARLETQIQKIVSAGLLKPGYYQDSQFTTWFGFLDNYFENPGDTLYTLSLAYPHLSSGLQQQVKSYLGNTFFPKFYDPVMRFRLGWQEGVQRTSAEIPPEVEADFANLPVDYRDGLEERQSWFYAGYLNMNPNNFYAMWKYAANVAAPSGGATALHIYQLAKDKLTKGSCEHSDCIKVGPNGSDAHLLEYPYEMNAYIAGLYGFIQLQSLAGRSTTDSDLRLRATTELNRLKNLRMTRFSKDSPWTSYPEGYKRKMLNISRNFIMLTPELAADMGRSILPQVRQALAEYETVGPYWFVSRFGAASAESAMQNLYDYPALFQARAYILKQPRSELTKYLDVPAFERGDLFYIQNLVAAIEASG